MKAIVLRALGGPEQLQLEDADRPDPGDGEVRIRVHAAGLNYTDLGQREGRVPGVPPLPFTPGVEAAGVVDVVGPGVHAIAVGSRVVAVLPRQGALAEYAVAMAASVTVIPPSLTFEKAVALPVQAPTALLALRLGAQLRDGETVVVPAAAGGVGSFLVQLAKRLGAARVIGIASSEAKRALAARLGTDVTIDGSQADWVDRVRAATDGRGADVVFERSGGEVTAESLKALAPRGRLVVFGVDSMFDTQIGKEQMLSLVAQNQSIVGFATFSLQPAVMNQALGEILSLVERGAIEVVVGQTFALENVADAHRAMAERKTTGKVVIRINEEAR